MDRREFLETVTTGAATTPLVVRSGEAAGTGWSDQQTPAQPASTEPGPRRRENFNRDWRFARQSKGTGALGFIRPRERRSRGDRAAFSQRPPARIRRLGLGNHQPASHLEPIPRRGARLLARHRLVSKAFPAPQPGFRPAGVFGIRRRQQRGRVLAQWPAGWGAQGRIHQLRV